MIKIMNTVEGLPLIAAIATIIGVLIAAISVFIAFWTIKNEIKKQRDISQQRFFAEYTKRYQEIILHLPEDLDNVTVLEDKETKRYLRVYFDLCSEEYFLYTKGHINEEDWKEWKDGMKSAFHKKAILEYWQKRKTGFYDFKEYAEKELITK